MELTTFFIYVQKWNLGKASGWWFSLQPYCVYLILAPTTNAVSLCCVVCDFNSWVPGGIDYSLKLVNFKLILTINFISIFCEIALRWMPQHLTDHHSTLVQVMAWCRQATSPYLSQCWPRSLSPYDVVRPQLVKFRVTDLELFSPIGCLAPFVMSGFLFFLFICWFVGVTNVLIYVTMLYLFLAW